MSDKMVEQMVVEWVKNHRNEMKALKEDRQLALDHSRVTHVKVVGGTKYYYYGDDEGGE